jgi:PKD repeat protein
MVSIRFFVSKVMSFSIATVLAAAPMLFIVAPKTAFAGGGGPCLGTDTPYASFTTSSYKIVGPADTSLDATSSQGCGDQVVNYSWDFGDGAVANGANTTHTYGLGTWQTTLTVTDEAGLQNSVTKTFTVKPENTVPVASDLNVQTNQGKTLVVDLVPGVSDSDGDVLDYAITKQPAHGDVYVPYEITPRTAATYAYYPDYDFYGNDSFTYQVSDGFGGVATATVNVTVRPALTAADDYATTDQGKAVTINVLANDIDSNGDFLWIWINTVSGGTAKVNPDSTITYQPDTGTTGEQTVTYYVSDARGNYFIPTVHITVNPSPPAPTPDPTPTPPPAPVNNVPVATNDNFTGNEDIAISGNVISNDSDKDGDNLTATVLSGTKNGALQFNSNGSFTYKPAGDWNGTDSFTYQISDGRGGISTATVTLAVTAINDAPMASFSFTTANPHTVSVNASASSDIEGTISAYKWSFGDGTAASGVNAQHRYAKGSTYQVTLTVTDNQGTSTSTTKQIQVK